MAGRDPTTGRFTGGGGGGGGGGTEVERLVVRLMGDSTSFTRMMRDAIVYSQKAANRIRAAGKRIEAVGRSVGRLGRSLSLRLTAPLLLMGGAAVTAFGSFDKAMIESTSIMQATTSQMRRMRETALTLSTQGVQGPTDLARSYFYLASAGLDAEQSMAALPQMMRFATAGAFDMARATDLATDAQSALGLTVKDAAANLENLTRVTDVLVKANTLANASVEQFSIALTSKAGASLRAYNKDIEEGVAVLAAMADQGMKAEYAGNNLSRIMLLLSKASRDAADEHKRLGFSVFSATGKMRNFADIVENLESVTEGMSDELKSATLEALGFEARIQAAVLPLLGTSDAIRRYEKELRKAAGTTKDVAEKQMKSFANRVKQLRNEVQVAAMEIGESLIPMIEHLMKKVREGIKWWKDLNQEMKETIVQAALVFAALGPVAVVLGSVMTAAGLATTAMAAMFANPIIAGVIALAGGVALVAKHLWDAKKAAEEYNQIATKMSEKGRVYYQVVIKQWKELQELAKKQNLSNTEAKRAQEIIDELEAYHGKLGASVRSSTEGFVGFFRTLAGEKEQKTIRNMTKFTNELAAAQIRLQQSNVKQELQRVREELAKLEMPDIRPGKMAAAHGEAFVAVAEWFLGIETAAEKQTAKVAQLKTKIESLVRYQEKLGEEIAATVKTPGVLDAFGSLGEAAGEEIAKGLTRKASTIRVAAEKIGRQVKLKWATGDFPGSRKREQEQAAKGLTSWLKTGWLDARDFLLKEHKALMDEIDPLLKDQKINIDFNVTGVEAVTIGSLAGRALLAEHLERMAAPMKPKAPKALGEVPAGGVGLAAFNVGKMMAQAHGAAGGLLARGIRGWFPGGRDPTAPRRQGILQATAEARKPLERAGLAGAGEQHSKDVLLRLDEMIEIAKEQLDKSIELEALDL